MIALNGLFKDKPYCMCKTPMNEDMTPFQPLRPKIGALDDKGQLYGKNAIRASDFLSNEPANTYNRATAAWNYVVAGKNCQKK
jgi:hypothetical protein